MKKTLALLLALVMVLSLFAGCGGKGKGEEVAGFELRRKAGDCSRVTAGPIDLI